MKAGWTIQTTEFSKSFSGDARKDRSQECLKSIYTIAGIQIRRNRMQPRRIGTIVMAVGLALGIGWFAIAQQITPSDLPDFAPGEVLTAEQLNQLVNQLLVNKELINDLAKDLVCGTRAACDSDPAVSEECEQFVDQCSTTADPLFCIQGGVFICEEEIIDDVDEGNVCSRDLCSNPSLAQECENFLAACLISANTGNDKEKCLGAAFLFCRE